MTSYWHKAAAESQARCDAIQAEFRAESSEPRSIRREPPPSRQPPSATDDPLDLRLAEELDYACRILRLMGDELSADPTVVVRHARSLQSIDIIGQIVGHVAAVVRSSDRPAEVERIGMAELRARLTRRGAL